MIPEAEPADKAKRDGIEPARLLAVRFDSPTADHLDALNAPPIIGEVL
jgi:hypothetical protein